MRPVPREESLIAAGERENQQGSRPPSPRFRRGTLAQRAIEHRVRDSEPSGDARLLINVCPSLFMLKNVVFDKPASEMSLSELISKAKETQVLSASYDAVKMQNSLDRMRLNNSISKRIWDDIKG